MAFDFPSSPTSGTVYQSASGPTYQWDGATWAVLAPASTTLVTSDSPPVNPINGQLWWQTSTGSLFIYYVDPSGVPGQWVQLPTATVPPQTAESRNRVVNGAFQISQEQANVSSTATTAINFYTADQWQTVSSTSPGTATAQRVQSTTPRGSKDRTRITIGTAKAGLAAGDFLAIQQSIEGSRVADFLYGSASAKQAVLRFGWKSPAGTYSVKFSNSAGNRSYLALFTISAGQANTDTEQVLVIPGDVTGTWLNDNSIGIGLLFTLAVGTTYQGAAGWQAGTFMGTATNSNGMATAAAVFELFDVGLYLDRNNTGLPPPWTMPDEAQELAACMRYWQSHAGLVNGTGAYTAGIVNHISTTLPVTMRTNPAVSPGNIVYSNANTLSAVANTKVVRASLNSVAAGNMSATFDVALTARM